VDLLANLERLRPFGVGNEEPLFLLPNVRVAAVSRIGAGGRHLRFAVEGDGRSLPGVAFRREEIPVDDAGRSDLLVAVHENVYRGARSLQLLLRDARPPGGVGIVRGNAAGVESTGRHAAPQTLHRRSSP